MKLNVKHDTGERKYAVWIDGEWVQDDNIISIVDMLAEQETKWGEERITTNE